MSGQKQDYKRKKLGKNLERAVAGASKKPVYVIERKDKIYYVKDYYQNKPLQFEIRSRQVAECLAEALNQSDRISGSALREIEYTEKLLRDLIHYRNYLDKHPTGQKAEVMDHRIDITLGRIRIAEHNAVKALNQQIRNHRKDK